MAAYKDSNDADLLRIDPAFRLSIGEGDEAGAGQCRLYRLENDALRTEAGLQILEDSPMRSNDTLMRRKKKRHLIVDVDSTENPVHCKQDKVIFKGHFEKNCFHPHLRVQAMGTAGGEADTRDKDPRVDTKIEWHVRELFPRI